jgi:hypothetical protein
MRSIAMSTSPCRSQNWRKNEDSVDHRVAVAAGNSSVLSDCRGSLSFNGSSPAVRRLFGRPRDPVERRENLFRRTPGYHDRRGRDQHLLRSSPGLRTAETGAWLSDECPSRLPLREVRVGPEARTTRPLSPRPSSVWRSSADRRSARPECASDDPFDRGAGHVRGARHSLEERTRLQRWRCA